MYIRANTQTVLVTSFRCCWTRFNFNLQDHSINLQCDHIGDTLEWRSTLVKGLDSELICGKPNASIYFQNRDLKGTDFGLGSWVRAQTFCLIVWSLLFPLLINHIICFKWCQPLQVNNMTKVTMGNMTEFIFLKQTFPINHELTWQSYGHSY